MALIWNIPGSQPQNKNKNKLKVLEWSSQSLALNQIESFDMALNRMFMNENPPLWLNLKKMLQIIGWWNSFKSSDVKYSNIYYKHLIAAIDAPKLNNKVKFKIIDSDSLYFWCLVCAVTIFENRWTPVFNIPAKKSVANMAADPYWFIHSSFSRHEVPIGRWGSSYV